MLEKQYPRVVIAAVQGRSGKTTVTASLLAALRERNLAVQPFKKGPDFIDPSWLSRVAGRQCRNLDLFLMKPADLVRSFARHARDADISVVEGAMGLFDGVDVEGSGSTAEIAKLLKAPVILVVNATRMTRSAAAVVLGAQHLDPGVHIGGIILNNVARPRHRAMLEAAIERYCGVPVVGAIPKRQEYRVPDRHLGLVPAGEDEKLHSAITAWTGDAEKHLDVDAILSIARSAEPFPAGPEIVSDEMWPGGSRPVIGVARDRAFSFYYPENLEALEEAGARLVFVDTLEGRLPELDGLYIGGGFPEIFARELEANEGMRRDVRDVVERGLPVYAECGGLMYLGQRLLWKGRRYRMSGALPFETDLDQRPRGHGYMVLQVIEENPYFTPGTEIRGHEFHHSRAIPTDAARLRYAFRVTRGYGIDGASDGFIYKNTLASYMHLHALSVPEWAPNFVRAAKAFKNNKAFKK
ncbi:MAG: hydrogenobyrinic acid a,c-diamide synthase (glutamine-hydrolyzing) [Peptococcaceae bacterium]|nr:hydrogenobyrinic acid a,c-diamide synthase (glutamine-hydrolyzing) [Peptococcaceae bacterium]